MSESKTPRTDDLLIRINEGRTYETVGPLSDHARQLETELEKARADLGEALDLIAALTFGRMAYPIGFLKKHGRIK
jgi:hypothetical protein